MTDRRTRSLLRGPAAARLRSQRWLVVVVGALVAGIFGMHALASHGTTAPTAGTVGQTVGTTGSSHADSHAGATTAAMRAMTDMDPRGDGASAAGSPGGSSHHMSSMVMLCVVVLAAAAVTLLGLLAGVVRAPRLPDIFWPTAVRTAVRRWVRGAGPPPEWQFSVIRC